MTSVSAFIRQSLDGLVHGSAAADPLLAARHRAFLGSQLALGFLALAGFPAWLALAGSLSPTEAVTFALLTAPLGLAAFLSRTGQFEVAQLCWALLMTALIAWIACLTGGTTSPVLIGLVLVPLEASLAGSPRLALTSAAFAGFGAIGVYLVSGYAVAPVVPDNVAELLVTLCAVAYAGLLATRLEFLHRFSDNTARRGEERYRLLADNATDLITLHDLAGRTQFASPASRAVLGAGMGDLLGSGLLERVQVADRPAFLTALSESASHGASASAEFRIRRSASSYGASPGGTFLWAEMRCRPARDDEGRIIAVVAVTRDISSRKSLESEIVAARETAERANAAKSRFLALMSHELRTPLNAVIGFSEILMTGLLGPSNEPKSRDYARLIHDSGEHLLEVVNGILDMSKIEAGKFEVQPEPFRVDELVIGCRDMMARQAANRMITIDCDINNGLPELVADRRAVRQILINLLSNAIKFSNEGGTVTIGIHRHDRMLALSVRDTGIGIRAEDLDRLGLPFEQVDSSHDRRYEGTGLGLSVVKGLIALHGGEFSIISKLGAGTTVTVRLPLEAAGAVHRLASGPAAREPAQIAHEERKIA